MLINSNAITVNTNDSANKADLSTSRTETKRSKRSIETIYENQELDTSSIVNSTVTLTDNPEISGSTEYSENTTPIKQTGSDATFIMNKKQKLNTETNESLTRPDSPPLPASSSELSIRRIKKRLNYKEQPINAKLRSQILNFTNFSHIFFQNYDHFESILNLDEIFFYIYYLVKKFSYLIFT